MPLAPSAQLPPALLGHADQRSTPIVRLRLALHQPRRGELSHLLTTGSPTNRNRARSDSRDSPRWSLSESGSTAAGCGRCYLPELRAVGLVQTGCREQLADRYHLVTVSHFADTDSTLAGVV
jgi:hypothetical protein